MADLMVGNTLGIAARDAGAIVAEISADGANTVTVSAADAKKFRIGQTIDIVTKADGTLIASARTVDGITAAGVITYSGANVTATPSTDAVYSSGDYRAASPTAYRYSNLNGGAGVNAGLNILSTLTIEDMKLRLAAIDAGFYTAAKLNTMTYNDLVYAIRLSDAASSI